VEAGSLANAVKILTGQPSARFDFEVAEAVIVRAFAAHIAHVIHRDFGI
jgi:hypothetical protein